MLQGGHTLRSRDVLDPVLQFPGGIQFHIIQLRGTFPKVFISAELCSYKGLDDIFCMPGTDNLSAHAQYIHVIMFNTLMGAVHIVTHAGPDAGYFISGNGG